MSQNLVRQRQRELQQIYNPQIRHIEQQMSQLPGRFDAQRQGMEQAKINAFRDIGLQARTRGRAWGGFTPAEQGRYLGEQYLPGLQQLDFQQNEARMGLLGQITGIRSQKAQGLMTFRDQLRQEQLKREAEERAFQRQQQLQRQQLAAQRASAVRSSGGGGSSGGGVNQIVQSIQRGFQGLAGRDGFVSPENYRRARLEWSQNRLGSLSDFDRRFSKFINPKQAISYLGPVTPAYMRQIGIR
jgi:hypothetical protein